MKFTFSVRSRHVPETSSTSAWPPSLPSVPTSRATRVTSAANERSWSTIVLIVSASAATSPLASTVIFCDRSPLAIAVVTAATLRTWSVRLFAIRFTLSVRSRQVPETPLTSAWPPSLPSVPTSRATRVTSSANEESWSTIVLIVSASAATSPLASTVIFWVRSPFATAVVTAAMLRTWSVRLFAIRFTLSVRSFQVPATPSTSAWPPSLPSVPTSRATRVTCSANVWSVSVIELIVSASAATSPLASTVIFWVRSPLAIAVVTAATLRTWSVRLFAIRFTLSVRSFQVPGHAGHVGLAAELALGADLARDARDLLGERLERVGHRVDRVGERCDLALGLDGDLLGEVAVGDRGGDDGDVADLVGQVVRHQVHVLGEVAPGAGDALDLGLAAELAFGADLAGDAGDLVGERGELVDHRVDGVLQLEDLALGVDRDLLREVAVRDGGRDRGDVADLVGQVRRHEVHRVGQVAPRARDALHRRLAAELAVGADLAGDAGDLVGERRELVDHLVHRRADAEELALHRLAADLQLHLLRQVAVGDRVHDARDLGGGADEVVDQVVDRLERRGPLAARGRARRRARSCGPRGR